MDPTEDGEMTAQLHPVSAMIISNHFTRCVLQNDGQFVQVIGALLGTQSARLVEVKNCFEIKSEFKDGQLEPDLEYFKDRQTMYSETFPDQAFLGFYITGDHRTVDKTDLYVHSRATEISDTAILLKLNPMVGNMNDKLPVSVFESAVDHNSGQTVLSSVTVKIVSETAEQIGTDHAAKSTTAGDKNETTAAKKLDELSGALKMLWKGLKLGQAYMLAVEAKSLPADPEIMRELHKLALKLDFLKRQMVTSSRSTSDLNDTLIVLLTLDNKVAGTLFSIMSKLHYIINEHSNPTQQTPMKRKEMLY